MAECWPIIALPPLASVGSSGLGNQGPSVFYTGIGRKVLFSTRGMAVSQQHLQLCRQCRGHPNPKGKAIYSMREQR